MPAIILQSLPDILALVLTLMVFSYLVGDNPLYRLAVHLFVGATAGYAVLVAYYTVIAPQMFTPIADSVKQGSTALLSLPTLLPALFGLMLSVFLLLKISPATTRLGSVATAFLVGVGSAVAVGGAVTGTLFPQTGATFLSLLPFNQFGVFQAERLIDSLIIIVGTLATLGFFYYGARARPGRPPERHPLAKPVAQVGQVFIGAAFGVMYAGALVASLAFFSDRLVAMWKVIEVFVPHG
jgi:hypothetical protein